MQTDMGNAAAEAFSAGTPSLGTPSLVTVEASVAGMADKVLPSSSFVPFSPCLYSIVYLANNGLTGVATDRPCDARNSRRVLCLV